MAGESTTRRENEDRLQAFLHKVGERIERAVNLRIITAIGQPSFTANDSLDLSKLNASRMICTQIDLIEGDITMVMHDDFLKDDLKELRSLHQEREKQGGLIVKNNIEALKEAVALVAKLREPSSG